MEVIRINKFPQIFSSLDSQKTYMSLLFEYKYKILIQSSKLVYYSCQLFPVPSHFSFKIFLIFMLMLSMNQCCKPKVRSN